MFLTGILYFLYIVVCLFLILVVLLQKGKRADLAGAFGGGGSQTAFGTRGAANALTKATTVAAVAFMLIALTLSIMVSRGAGQSGSVLDEVAPDGAPAVETEQLPEAGSELPGDGTEEAPALPTAEDGTEPETDPVEEDPAP